MSLASQGLLVPAGHILIRGRQLAFDDLVDSSLFQLGNLAVLRERLRSASPFPHLVARDWFNPDLLDLVHEEFDQFAATHWKVVEGKHERTFRSLPGATLGPAAQIYFNLVNSAWFLDLVGFLLNVDHPVADPHLYGGGLHECRAGGRFDVHRDFDRHLRNGLHHEAVLITYLNRDWDPAWGGALELWDGQQKAKIAEVAPQFGHTILMPHGPKSYHGHPDPLQAPPDRPRRSVASYYYSNRDYIHRAADRKSSLFMFGEKGFTIRQAVFEVTPPVVRKVARKARDYLRGVTRRDL